MSTQRYVALWVPNWPLASLVVDVPPDGAAITVRGNRVSVATPKAQNLGVRIGMTVTLAQYHCPNLMVLKHDVDRESGAFEALLEVFDSYAAGVTVVRPGLAFAPAASASKWVGSEESLAEKIVEDIAAVTGAEAYVGIAKGLGTALLAARKGQIVSSENTQQFLRCLSLKEMVQDLPDSATTKVDDLLEVLSRLGVHNGQQLESLGHSAVISRFGQAGISLMKLMSGDQPLLETQNRSEGDVHVRFELDPPTEQLEHAATAIARASNELTDLLRSRTLYSSTIQVCLESREGRIRERTWTLLDANSSSQVAKRITWQLRGWLNSGSVSVTEDADPLAAIELIALSPTSQPEVDPLWGGVQTSWKAAQSVEQIQGLLGEDAVLSPRLHGGFDPRTRVSLTPWGIKPGMGPSQLGEWEGGVSEPPVILFSDPPPAMLMGLRSNTFEEPSIGTLWITRRGVLNGMVQRLIVQQDREELAAGDYPLSSVKRIWIVRGRWWTLEDAKHGPRCYMRVGIEHGSDLLLIQRKGNWYVEGRYGVLSSVNSPNTHPQICENYSRTD